MLPDYLVINGLEIINSTRAAAYAGNLTDECDGGGGGLLCFDCPDLEQWLTHGHGYQGITTDPAPWWDPASPESARVYGIAGLAVEGLATGAYPQEGSLVRSPSGATRDIMFRIVVQAADECALTYITGWLREALRATCGDACSGGQACVLACCPEFNPTTGQPVTSPVRHLFGLVAVEGPELVDRSAIGGPSIHAVFEFTLRTSNVNIYRPPREDQVVTIDLIQGEPVTLDLNAVYDACTDPTPCVVDPSGITPQPPQLPAPPVDPRYPTDPYPARRTIINLPATWMSRGIPVVPVITIEAGGGDHVRNFLYRVYHNPFGHDCTQFPDLNPCRACTDGLVPFIPGNGKLVIDGRTHTRVVTCRDRTGTATDNALMFGPKGGIYVDPVFVCGSSMCLELYTAEPTPGLAKATIELWQSAGAG